MPRKRKAPGGAPDPRGGPRQGAQGAQYSNRSDLQTGPRQPVKVPPSAEYGQGARLERAQQAVPLPAAPGPPMVTPEQVPTFGNPTSRPNEPLSAGLPFGPGPGPRPQPAAPPTDPDLEALQAYLPTLELLASQPNASPTARIFVRRLRGAMPPPGATPA
jgi:hypothetical protein